MRKSKKIDSHAEGDISETIANYVLPYLVFDEKICVKHEKSHEIGEFADGEVSLTTYLVYRTYPISLCWSIVPVRSEQTLGWRNHRILKNY